jgi:hypothetical protein
MKKLAILALALLLGTALQAQEVRANYRIDGMTHIATVPESISFGNVPGKCNIELVGFPDGSTLYLMYLTLEPAKKASTAAPKGVKMGVTLNNGKLVRLEQMGQYPASSKVTQLKYAVESADMEKMVRGIKSVDIVTGWDPDDYVQANFSNDEFGALLKRHCENILKASENTVESKATLAERQETVSSIMTTTNPLVGRGANYDYNILLSHLAYKNGDKDDVDLYFVIGTKEQFHIPFDAAVRFTLTDGSVIGLLQARDDVNFVLVYPSMEDLGRMIEVGISSLSIDYEGGTLTDTFPAREDGELTFSQALGHELQLIYYVNSL